MKKYTLDRITGGKCVFLDRDNESDELIIPAEKVKADVKEGDIVSIEEESGSYKVTVLQEETEAALDKVNALLEKLKKKSQ